MEKVIVLMSTYNGEKYVKDQIDSILDQSYENIEIYVRDDGSKDRTVDILRDYEVKGYIKLKCGENSGFIKSFFNLIEEAPDSDYYAFCDQDDIWKKDKVEQAVSLMNKKNKEKPLLYFSDYDYYDDDMNFVARCTSHKRGPSFQNSLVDCISLGISSVMNKAACDEIKAHIPKHSCGHDWWAYMICAGLGEVIYDKTPTVQYRRNGNNVSPGGMSFIKFQIWRIKKFIVNDYFKNVRDQLNEYYELYYNQLSEENKKELKLFAGDGSRLLKVLKKFCRTSCYRQGLSDELMIRFMFLIGKL